MVVRCIVALTVTGTPQVPLIIGGTTRYADYVPALSGASALVFSYTVQKTDYDNDGIQYNGPTPWRMNGGSVVLRGHKTTATLLPASCTTDWIYINSDEGYVSAKVNGGGSGIGSGGGTSPGDGGNPGPSLGVSAVRWTGTPASGATYRLDERIQAAVTFTEAVTVTGAPQLGLTIGTQTRQAVYDATQSKGTLVAFSYYVQATDIDADGIGIAANALTLNGGMIHLASDSATAAALAQACVGTDDTRKVDGSTEVAEHDDSRAEATLVTLTARTTGGVGETGQTDDFRADVATEGRAEVAGALEQPDDADYFRVEGAHDEAVTGLYTLAVRFTPAGGGTQSGGDAVSEHGNMRAAATRVGVNSETRGALEQAGDVDYFAWTPPQRAA